MYQEEGRGFYRRTARAGGLESGVSTGEPMVIHVAMKSLSTLIRLLDSVDMITKQPVKAHIERSDVCAVPAASVVGEAVLALAWPMPSQRNSAEISFRRLGSAFSQAASCKRVYRR